MSSVLSLFSLPLFPQFLSLFPSPSPSLYMFVSAGLSRPVNLSAVSEDRALRFSCSLLPFPVVLSPFFLCCVQQTHTHTHTHTHTCTFPHMQTHTNADKLILSHCLKYLLPLSRSLAFSQPHAHTHTLCQKHTPTQGPVFKCSNEYEWAQNEECVSN